MRPDGTFPPSDDDEAPDAQEIERQAEEIAALRKDYQELIYAVGNKWPGETRHQTALRYIYNAEHQEHGPSQRAPIDAALAQGNESGSVDSDRDR